MLKVLTAAQMREVDRLTTERYGIPSISLMENAAHAVVRVITEKLGGSVQGKHVVIFCGTGNNGGDGAAIGRLLLEAGAVVTVELFGKVSDTTGDARTNFDSLLAIGRSLTGHDHTLRQRTIDTEDPHYFDGWLAQSDFDQADLVVDAIFGTGLSRPLEGFFDELAGFLRNWRNGHERPLFVSVDIPSGLGSDTGMRSGTNVHAHATVTFTAPKAGNVVPPASSDNGALTIADIGSPSNLVEEQDSQLFLAERSDVVDWLQSSEFTSASYKNKRGHALIIAGSTNYTGAAVLCGDAGIRSGVGLVTIATPESSRDGIVARVSPEVMVRGISETENGSAAEKAFDEVNEFLENVDVIAIGSGLSSKEDETKGFIRRIIVERETPVLIDADGLTALSPWNLDGREAENHPVAEAATPLLGKEGSLDLVLTPHEGEFRKLLGLGKDDFEEVIKDRVTAVRDFATKHGVFLVLKGERNLIGAPDGRVVVNPTGNPGLGKAGNGDTLTGILAGFMAQAVQMKIDMLETLVAAVYVAGMAGDIAEKTFGKRVMTASDVRECLVDVFAELNSQE